MSLITILVILIVVGVALYLVTLIPMDPTVRKIIGAVVVLAVVLWLLNQFFDLGAISFGRRHTR